MRERRSKVASAVNTLPVTSLTTRHKSEGVVRVNVVSGALGKLMRVHLALPSLCSTIPTSPARVPHSSLGSSNVALENLDGTMTSATHGDTPNFSAVASSCNGPAIVRYAVGVLAERESRAESGTSTAPPRLPPRVDDVDAAAKPVHQMSSAAPTASRLLPILSHGMGSSLVLLLLLAIDNRILSFVDLGGSRVQERRFIEWTPRQLVTPASFSSCLRIPPPPAPLWDDACAEARRQVNMVAPRADSLALPNHAFFATNGLGRRAHSAERVAAIAIGVTPWDGCTHALGEEGATGITYSGVPAARSMVRDARTAGDAVARAINGAPPDCPGGHGGKGARGDTERTTTNTVASNHKTSARVSATQKKPSARPVTGRALLQSLRSRQRPAYLSSMGFQSCTCGNRKTRMRCEGGQGACQHASTRQNRNVGPRGCAPAPATEPPCNVGTPVGRCGLST